MYFVYRAKQFILVAGDLVSFVTGFWLSLLIRHFAVPTQEQLELHLALFAGMFLLWMVVNYINGLYDLGKHDNFRIFRRLFEAGAISFVVSIVFFYVLPSKTITPKTILALNVAIGYGLAAIWRFAYTSLIVGKRLETRVALVGWTPESRELLELLDKKNEKGYHIIAVVDPAHAVKGTDLPGIDVFHGLHTVRPVISNYKAEILVIAPHLQHDALALRELYELLFWNVQITDFASFYELVTGRIPPSTFSEGWFLEHLRNTKLPIYDRVRVFMDYAAGIFFGALFLVLLPFLALAIKATSKGPLFIRQKRVGLFGKEFIIYKLRSMYALSPDGSAEVGGYEFDKWVAQKGDKRVTPVGVFLRKTRMDELPQVWNLLKRDLTLIGPRPERPEIVRDLTAQMPYYPLRHLVKPGLTGWAVIHQNYTETIKKALEKLQYDLYYIKNRSFLLDVLILLRTINVIVRFRGQ